MALRFNRFLDRRASWRHKHGADDGDDDDDNVSLCSDMDRSNKHGVRNMMTTFNLADMTINSHIVGITFQPYHLGGGHDLSEEDSDISADDFGDDNQKHGNNNNNDRECFKSNTELEDTIFMTSFSDSNPVIVSDHSNSEDSDIFVDAPCNTSHHLDMDIVGTKWVQNGDDDTATRHLELDMLPRSDHQFTHRRNNNHDNNRHSRSSSYRRHGRRSQSERNDRTSSSSATSKQIASSSSQKHRETAGRAKSAGNDNTLVSMREAAMSGVKKNSLSESTHRRRRIQESSHRRLDDSTNRE
jgi:hypothetical protein